MGDALSDTPRPSPSGDPATMFTLSLPDIPYAAWRDTQATLHRFLQLVGKIRLAHSARRNHWWNVAYHVTGRGITTRPMSAGAIFTIDFDFVDHRLEVITSAGARHNFSLLEQSVASFTGQLDKALRAVGIDIDIVQLRPFDLDDADQAFADDHQHSTYDPFAVTRYWRVLSQVNLLLEQFAGRWSGKTSPVHHFWHSFDIAVTRFGDRDVKHPPTVDPVTREAYSREVISFGFWFGDPTFPEPAFYSYTAPEPPGLTDRPLEPAAAEWTSRSDGSLAVLRYDALRAERNPRQALLGFYESAFLAGARTADWDVSRHTAYGGATDLQFEVS